MAEKLSLTELQFIIRDALYMSLPDLYWVIAEISELNENQTGHCYLELIEKQADDKNIKSRARGIIWSSRYRFLKSFFENITGESLRTGLKVLIKVKVEYHEIYGLSLIISDIDPAFTIGEMAVRKQLIIKQLEQEGVFGMNKELDFPLFPRRIAVISSKNAAGYTDFMNHLRHNSYGYIFYTALFESAMQGAETEHGIIGSLNKIAENDKLFDLVVIIRGGGSQTDLSWFDNYNIAYHITQFPLPVITGIGHEKDLSVTDMVAYTALKTPTAVADYIIDNVAQVENHLVEMSMEIKNLSHLIVEKNKTRIEYSKMRLLPLSKIMISDIKEKLSGKIIEIINIGKKYVYKAGMLTTTQRSQLLSVVKSYSVIKKSYIEDISHKLNTLTLSDINNKNKILSSLANTLNILKPENVLQRGFTITSLNGKILKRSDQVTEEDIIDTQFSDGKVKSKVVNVTKDRAED
jgi:exodeoxyribonuclease VII large subunit